MPISIRSFFLSLSFVFASAQAFAQPQGRVELLAQVFTSIFQSHYVAAQCGDNILNLIKIANAQGVDFSRANVIQITNSGNFNFGMVGGFQARGRLLRPPGKPERIAEPALSNWYHHVILEVDGLIYDFDFTNKPRVTPVPDYIEAMLIAPEKWPMGAKITPREDRLRDDKISIFTAESYLSGQRASGQDMSLGQFLNHHLHLQ